ncbi:methyl-accepting chemotaxis protein [uncultured Desulfovibrio sp.]|uniref:methyl-accepting chemotaxis protein n=1 Tax=uncultured Desulfovibrio sp. TaxID=167968 RepID=UPI0026160166|nr:methyl-accepting chemotaxis protein [uncultured Desulfovibrio sp.]
MSIGKKIAGGFALVLLLALGVGIMAQLAITDGLNASNKVTHERFPRYAMMTRIQAAYLLAGYRVRIYLDSGDAAQLQEYQNFEKNIDGLLSQLEEFNKKYPGQNTTDFLAAFGKDYTAFKKAVADAVALLQNIYQTRDKLIASSTSARSMLKKLSATMSGTLTEYVNQGGQQESIQYAQNMARVASVLENASTALQQLLVGMSANDLDRIHAVPKNCASLLEEMEGIRQYLLRKECRAMFDDVWNELHDFASNAEDLAALLEKREAFTKARLTHYFAALAALNEFEKSIRKILVDFLDESDAGLERSEKLIIGVIVVMLVVGILLALLITRMIVTPLRKTQEFAHAVAAGDLERNLDVHSTDETGKLAESLRVMVTSLKENIKAAEVKSAEAEAKGREATEAMKAAQEAQKAAEGAKREGMLAAARRLESVVEAISTASTQLSAQIEQSDRSAQVANARLSEAATAMNEMNSTVQEVARNAAQASTMSSNTRSQAEAGAEIVQRSLGSIKTVHEMSSELKKDMTQLNDHAQSISNIMSVISDIADQTNLLALNAAIEAARAGEAGRGFAVVADEVRKLAEKTMASTTEVGSAIRAIQDSTAKSVESMDHAVEQIEQATDFANQSGEALKQIVGDVETTADEVRAIAAAAEEQSAASDEINKSIVEVNDVVAQTAAAMNEAATAVNTLAGQSHELSNLIESMKQG